MIFQRFLLLFIILSPFSMAKEAKVSTMKLIYTLDDVTSKLCVDCFGRNLMAMFECLGEKSLLRRVSFIRLNCPAAPDFFQRYIGQLQLLQ